MKILQGHVVPHLIGVYVNPVSFTIAMELPHSTFWMEASSDMPDILKEQCIAAVRKIHSCGVLHNDIELRHMLIGADGKVTIIDFQESRALLPNSAVGLEKAEPRELELELRKVKFKLDYKGAREVEFARMRRAIEASKPRKAGIADSESTGQLDEDGVPLPDFEEWRQRWLPALYAEKKRIVVPGQDAEKVKLAERQFAELVGSMEVGRATSQVETDHSLQFTNPPSLERPTVSLSSQARDTVLGKRQAPEDLSPSSVPARRPRLFQPSSSTATVTSPSPPQRSIKKPRHPPNTDPELPPLPPLPIHFKLPLAPSNDYLRGLARTPPPSGRLPVPEGAPQHYPILTSSSHTESASPNLLPAAREDKPRNPIKSVDYATKTPEGPRGYYFPHPPTEHLMAMNRFIHVRQQNYLECRRLELPYFGGNSFRLHTATTGAPPRGYFSSLGRLKRARQSEDSGCSTRTGSPGPRKKQRVATVDAPGWDPRTGYAISTETLNLSRGRATHSSPHAEELKPPARTQRPQELRATKGGGILRTTQPIKTVDYSSWFRFGKDGPLLPPGVAPKNPPSDDADDQGDVTDLTLSEDEQDAQMLSTNASNGEPSPASLLEQDCGSICLGISQRGSIGTTITSSSMSAAPPIPITRRPRASPMSSLRKRMPLSASPPSAVSFASQATGPFSHLGSSLRGSPRLSTQSRASPNRRSIARPEDIEMLDEEEERIVETMVQCTDEDVQPEQVCRDLASYVFSRWS